MIPAVAVGGFAVCAAGVAVTQSADGASEHPTAPLAMPCPSSLTDGIFVAGCVPGVNPPPGAVDERGPGELPTLYGIPCTGSNMGTCIGLSRLPTAVAPTPDTTVRSSP